MAAPRNPPPVFESEYTLPDTETPLPNFRTPTENYLALGLYAAALVSAVLAVHYYRSRRAVFLLAVGSVVVFGFVLQGCPCPVGSLQNTIPVFFESIGTGVEWIWNTLRGIPTEQDSQTVPPGATLSGTTISGTTGLISVTAVLLFSLPLLVALFYGRVFCGAVCPLGAVQELVAIKPLRLPAWIDDGLGTLRFVFLGLGVLFAQVGLWFLICRFDPFVGLFRMSGFFSILVFGFAILLLGLIVARPFCRFLCPYGALLGLCGSLAAKKVSVTPGECSKCRLCEEICPVNAIRPPTTDPTPEERFIGPLRLLILFLAAPLIVVALTGIAARLLPGPLASMHPDVRLAERVLAEDSRLVDTTGYFAETKAFQITGQTNESLYRRAESVYGRMRHAAVFFGAWCGIVFAVKLISLGMRRRRTDYRVDPGRCVACGRCFWYCPNQKEKRVLLDVR
ncbi:MAG TPA: 4Fe-4S ferredoxin [Planctomycetaceae bacterium]|nr:4Fe-4S ferredoxin [Planctomycetaceae bacterium]